MDREAVNDSATGSGEESRPAGARLDSAGEVDPLVGTTLDGRYRILERLAAGGMGVVYRGERLELERAVAIKFLHAGLMDSKDSIARFKREALTMSRLTHPNCVSVIDIGIGESAPYIVMDFVTGRTLEDVLTGAGRLGPGRAIYLTKQVLSALTHAHGQKLVHRDIKPANIMLSTAEGTADHVFVLDFGLAKFNNMSGSDITGASVLLGTPAYMSPEQTKGQNVGPESDVYSTAVLLFELLTGGKPYSADTPLEILYMHQGAPIPSIRARAPGAGFSEDLDKVIEIALAKEPDRRFESAAAFATALAAVPEASTYEPPRLAQPRSKHARGKRIRREDRIAFASTQPVSTIELEQEDGGEASGAGPTGRQPSGGQATVAITGPDKAVTPPVGQGATQALAPAVGTGDSGAVAGAEPSIPGAPSARPATESAVFATTRPAATGGRPRWLIPGIVLAVVVALVVAVLAMSSDGESEQRAASAGSGDAGVRDASTTSPDSGDAGDAAPEEIVVRRVEDVDKLIEQGRTEEAIAGIDKLLASTHKNNPYLLYRLGNLHFERGGRTKALELYKRALTKKRAYRKYASINENIIECLGSKKTRQTAYSLYTRIIKRDGLRYLKKAKVEHENRLVRRHASRLYDRIAGRR